MNTEFAADQPTKRSAFKNKHSTYERDPLDFYIEPDWVTELLIDALPGWQYVWDPACGSGTIVKTLSRHSIPAIGSDIVERWSGAWVGDFLTSQESINDHWSDIVTNPPYKHAEAFIRRGLDLRARRLAVLVRLDFLASQRRHKLFAEHPPQFVFVLSRRPNIPPGPLDRAVTPKGGQADFCWIVWESFRKRFARCEIKWLL